MGKTTSLTLDMILKGIKQTMHTYFRAIGFCGTDSQKILKEFISKVINSDEVIKKDFIKEEETIEIFKYINQDVGVAIHGQFNPDNILEVEYCFPFARADHYELMDDITIEKKSDSMAFNAAYDDEGKDLLLVFYLQNCLDFINYSFEGMSKLSAHVGLSAFSVNGMVLLPALINNEYEEAAKKIRSKRYSLIKNAKQGVEDTGAELASIEIGMFDKMRKRINSEDLYSVLDTVFMPHGIECTRYSIVGNIINVNKIYNSITGVASYNLLVESNDIIVNVIINEFDIEGEPLEGRRFKGVIWLQGRIDFNCCIGK